MLSLLQQLTSPDNELRRRAEAEFDSHLRTNANEVILGLNSVTSAVEAQKHLRGLAIILLRRVLTRQSELWTKTLSIETKRTTEMELLNLLDTDSVDR